jgi:hypothetical protein
MKTLLLPTSFVLLVGGAMRDTRHTNVTTSDAVKWTEDPAVPKGIQIDAGRRSNEACETVV